MLVSTDAIAAMFGVVTAPIAVINEKRQIVHANRSLLRMAGCSSVEDVLGMRLGEAMGCVHATEDLSGCGTHPSCTVCGTVNAALCALNGRPCVAEVNLSVERAGQQQAFNFDLHAEPLTIRGRLFALLKVETIED